MNKMRHLYYFIVLAISSITFCSCDKEECCHCDLDEINHKIDSLISNNTISTDTISTDGCIYCKYGLCGKTFSYLYDKRIFFHFYHNAQIHYCSYNNNGEFFDYVSYPNEFEYITYDKGELKFAFYATSIQNGCVHKLSLNFRNGGIYVTETCNDCKCYGGGYLELIEDPFVIN